MSDSGQSGGSWTLLTGHGHVLVEIARNPGARIRDISAVVGLTDRTVQAIVADLEAAGYLTRTRTGRRTRYTVNHDSMFRTPPRKDFGSAPSSACSRRPTRTPAHPGLLTALTTTPELSNDVDTPFWRSAEGTCHGGSLGARPVSF